MNKSIRLLTLMGSVLLSASVFAADIKISDAWSRASAPGQDVAMVDLSITSEKDASLVAISSTACKSVELHSMTHENGMMKMREVKSAVLPAGKRVNLGDSGYHLMLIGLKAPLKAGESIPLTLSIKTGKETVKIETSAEIKSLTEKRPEPQQQDEHMHHMHH